MIALSFYIVCFRLSSLKGKAGPRCGWNLEAGSLSRLEFDSQTNAVITRRSNTGAREEAGKIDHIKPVVKVLHVGLQAHEQVFSLHQFGADRGPER